MQGFSFFPRGGSAQVVAKDKTVHYRRIQVGRDYGTRIEVLSGLEENDRVLLNPTAMFREGDKVEPVAQDGSP